MAKKRMYALLGCLALFLVAAVTAVVWLHPWRTEASSVPPSSGAATNAPAAPKDELVVHTGAEPAEQRTIAEVSGVLGGLPKAVTEGRSDWLADSSPAKGTDPRSIVPAGATVTVDGASWRRTGSVGSVTVTVRVPESADRQLRVLMLHQAQGWKVSETYPAGAA